MKVALAGTGVFAASTAATWGYVNSEVNNYDAELVDLRTDVSVIMPTLNEEELIEESLRSLRAQNVVNNYPKLFEFIVVDSESEDATVALAQPYASILTAPPGLLNARALAISQSRGEIVVSVNADTFYPPNYLNLLLAPFSDPGVVATQGIRIYEGVLGPFSMYGALLRWDADGGPLLSGSNSAFRRWAFDKIGGFDLNVNQMKGTELQWAEEVDLAKRLTQVGKYVMVPKAVAFTSPRRLSGKLPPKHFRMQEKIVITA